MATQAADVKGAPELSSRALRKPYVVRKSREKWNNDEHERFVEAVERFGRSWSSIVDHIGTRSVAQVRSHAQKYFLKLQHQGRADAVPPPRPKRRSSKPYPIQQKIDKPAHQALPDSGQFCDESPSADLGSGDSSGGHASNAGSATSSLSAQDESSETSVHIPSHLQRPAAQASIQEGSAPHVPPPNINRLHQALDIVLHQPYAPTQQSAQDAEGYAAQRAAVMARLNQLKCQLDSNPICRLPAARQSGLDPSSSHSTRPCEQSPTLAAAQPSFASISHVTAGQRGSLSALDPTGFAQQPSGGTADSSNGASAWMLPTGQGFQYPATASYTAAAAQQFRSSTATPVDTVAGMPLQEPVTSLGSANSLNAAAPSWQHHQHFPICPNPVILSPCQGQDSFSHQSSAAVSQLLPEAVGVPCSWYDSREQAMPGVSHGMCLQHSPVSALQSAQGSAGDGMAALAEPKEASVPAEPGMTEGSIEAVSKMLRPPSFPCGLDLDGFDPWALDSITAFSSLEGASCSNESPIADFDPAAWLQL